VDVITFFNEEWVRLLSKANTRAAPSPVMTSSYVCRRWSFRDVLAPTVDRCRTPGSVRSWDPSCCAYTDICRTPRTPDIIHQPVKALITWRSRVH